MSGHSHWHNIRQKKGKEDARKSKIFSKYSKIISIAAKDGSNPNENPKLKQWIEKAKADDVPSDTIERAIKKGAGEIEGVEYKEIMLEAYGPSKTAFIIECVTDNKNRTLAEIKKILNNNQGKLAEQGSVKYMFDNKGIIEIDLEKQPAELQEKDTLELLTIDAGAEEVTWDNNILETYTDISNLEQMKQKLTAENVVLESGAPGWKPKLEVELSDNEKEKINRLLSDLDEHDDVQEVYTNIAY